MAKRNRSDNPRKDNLSHIIIPLIRLRVERGISQLELSWKIGVSDCMVGRWERGKKTPTLFNLICWADALGARFLVAANDNSPPDEPCCIEERYLSTLMDRKFMASEFNEVKRSLPNLKLPPRFRGLQNIEVPLTTTTVLTGMNNVGKTSLLRALQIALGNTLFITRDDFYISDSKNHDRIIVDLKIVPTDDQGKSTPLFDDDWEVVFTEERIRTDDSKSTFVPLRTIVSFDEIKNSYKSKQYVLENWPAYIDSVDNKFWYESSNGNEKNFNRDEVPFFYVDAQRDILEDMKTRGSFLGKMISKIEYSKDVIEDIENQIKLLNDDVVTKSEVLTEIKTTLIE